MNYKKKMFKKLRTKLFHKLKIDMHNLCWSVFKQLFTNSELGLFLVQQCLSPEASLSQISFTIAH